MKYLSELIKHTEEFYKQSLWDYFLVKNANVSSNPELQKLMKEKIDKLKPAIEKSEKIISDSEDVLDNVVNNNLYEAFNDEDDESSLLTAFKNFIEYAKRVVSTNRINRTDLQDLVYNVGAGIEGVGTAISRMRDSDWEEESADADELADLLSKVSDMSSKVLQILTGEEVELTEFLQYDLESLQSELGEVSAERHAGMSDAQIEAMNRQRESRRKANQKYFESISNRSKLGPSHPLFGTDVYNRALAVMNTIKKSKADAFKRLKDDPDKYALYLENQRKKKKGIGALEDQIAKLKIEMKYASPDEEDKIRRRILSIERRIGKRRAGTAAVAQRRRDVKEGKSGELVKVLSSLRTWVATARMAKKDKYFDPIVDKIILKYKEEEYSKYIKITEKIAEAKRKFDSAKASGSKPDFDNAKKNLEKIVGELRNQLYTDMADTFAVYMEEFEKTHGKELYSFVTEVQKNKLPLLLEVSEMSTDSMSDDDREKINQAKEFISEIKENITSIFPKIGEKGQKHLSDLRSELEKIKTKISIG